MPDQISSRPEWAVHQGSAEIARENYTDKNFVRKAVYDASPGQKKRMIVWVWDAEAKQLKNPMMIFANEKGIPELARAMEKLMPDYPAHFIGSSGRLDLFMLDGHRLAKTIPFTHNSFNQHPANDWRLIRDMPDRLDQIRNRRMGYPQSMQSLKAWINVETGSVIKFPAAQKFDKIIMDSPEKFEIPDGISLLQARIAAERKGWVAFGINAENRKNIIAVVQAMSEQQALRAAKAMWRIKKVDWDVLKVVTNDANKTFEGDQIEQYVSSKTNQQESTIPVAYTESLFEGFIGGEIERFFEFFDEEKCRPST